MVEFFSKKWYAAITDQKLAIKLLNERCLECSICAMFFNSSLTVSIKALFLSNIGKFFDVMMAIYTLKPTTKRKYHRDFTMSKTETMFVMILFLSQSCFI